MNIRHSSGFRTPELWSAKLFWVLATFYDKTTRSSDELTSMNRKWMIYFFQCSFFFVIWFDTEVNCDKFFLFFFAFYRKVIKPYLAWAPHKRCFIIWPKDDSDTKAIKSVQSCQSNCSAIKRSIYFSINTSQFNYSSSK